MSPDLRRCPKCETAMELGFMVDHTHGGRTISRWAPGSPRKSFWTGVKVPRGALPIGSFRCSQCGYLEFFAGEEFAAE